MQVLSLLLLFGNADRKDWPVNDLVLLFDMALPIPRSHDVP